jgi:hypothetical protein
MQKISLLNFKKDIDSIREYIKHIKLINNIALNNRELSENTLETSSPLENSLKEFSEHLYSFNTNKKLFEYKAIVISLYGVLEKHIGIWIQEHIDTLPNIIPSYDKLPDRIYKNHFDLSIKLISLISENKFSKNEQLRKEDVLIRLSSCINFPSDYKLNSDAFIPLSGNLKHLKIVEAFRLLDIELVKKLKNNISFSTFLKEKYGERKYLDYIDKKSDKLFIIIDNLVSLRNDIAHGVDIDDILGITEFDNYINFLENYGEAIFETLVEKETQYEASFLYTQIVNIKKIHGKRLLCFELDNNKIKVGDDIIIKTKDDYFLKKEILEIQQDNVAFSELNITEKADIGINLGSGITESQTFYIKR